MVGPEEMEQVARARIRFRGAKTDGIRAGVVVAKAGAEEVGILLLCNIDYEHTQSTRAGAPGVDPGQLITESRLFPQRQTDG